MKTRIKRSSVLTISLAAMLTVASYAADSSSPQPEPTGRWLTESGNLEIELGPTNEGLCGTVARVISSRSMSESKPQSAPTDPNSLMGMKILQNLQPSGKNEWKGHIYNRDNGKTYDCVVTFVPPDQLNVRGYSLLPLFGKTQVWRRVAAVNP